MDYAKGHPWSELRMTILVKGTNERNADPVAVRRRDAHETSVVLAETRQRRSEFVYTMSEVTADDNGVAIPTFVASASRHHARKTSYPLMRSIDPPWVAGLLALIGLASRKLTPWSSTLLTPRARWSRKSAGRTRMLDLCPKSEPCSRPTRSLFDHRRRIRLFRTVCQCVAVSGVMTPVAVTGATGPAIRARPPKG